MRNWRLWWLRPTRSGPGSGIDTLSSRALARSDGDPRPCGRLGSASNGNLPGAEPNLIASVRHAAADTFEVDALVASARTWLFEHRYVIPPMRRLRQLAVAARRHREAVLLGHIEASVPAEVCAGWLSHPLQPVHPETDVSRLGWLRAGPVSKKP